MLNITKITKKLLIESFSTQEARDWYDSKNDVEFRLRKLNPEREVLVFCGRASKVTSVQLTVANALAAFKWQCLGMVQRSATDEFALVLAYDKSTSVVYPDGTSTRDVKKFSFKDSAWIQTFEQAEAAIEATVEAKEVRQLVRIPLAVEQVPSHARGMQWQD